YWDNVIYGSHEVLVTEIINANFEVQINKLSKRMNGYLDYSNSNGIFKVNPNFTYYISENKPMRMYPRKKFKLKTSEEVLNLLLPAFEEEVKWLDNQNQKLYLSLTGGFDSKVTMALTKNIQEKMSYFTYMKNTENATERTKWIHNMDKRIVDKLRYNLNLNHKYIHIDDIEVPQERIKQLSTHTTSNHAYKLGLVLGEKLQKNSLHIRSTLYELGKTPYNLN